MIAFLSMCINKAEVSNDPRGKAYAGPVSCRQCHQAVYNAYVRTAHHHTTMPASMQNVQGSFTAGNNTFAYNPQVSVVMEHRDSGMFQVAYVNGIEKEAHRFDITFGLKHAQTFAYWKENRTFELPVSYYTSVKSWASSPGFSAAAANFNRFVGKECFECHSSYIDGSLITSTAGIQQVFDKSSLVYGIDCERCHGPAINHVNFHLAHPDNKEARYIVTSGSLSRQQKLDMCAVCHSGNDKTKEVSTFKFRPGDTLANFFSPWASHNSNHTGFDVHGNQYQLLSESKCFSGSKTLDCTTCHSPHTDAGSNLADYSQKCISCHKDVRHNFANETAVNKINSNCIDCHMPKLASRAITFQLAGSAEKSAYLLRTHKIAVYR